MARQTVGGGVSNPSAVIDDISRERGKEKFQSSISAILCLVESKSFVPSPPIDRFLVAIERDPGRRFQNVCFCFGKK